MSRRIRELVVSVVLVGLCALTGGCAKIVGIEDTKLGAGLDFACVGQVVVPPGDGSDVEIVASIVDIATQMPVEGMRVVRCETRLDSACVSTEPVFSDATGVVHVPVKSGFNGYLRIQDPDGDVSDDGWVTYFWYFSQPIVETRADPFPIYAMTRAFRRDTLYGQVGATFDDALGEVAINSTDCQDANAPGVRFEVTTPASLGSSTIPFYFVNNFFDSPAMMADAHTDGSGLGGYLGVESGQVGIRAVLADSGETVAEDTLLVRPDVLTTVRLLPQ